MTEKERQVQKALGLLNTYWFIVQLPPIDAFDRGREVGVKIEAPDLDSACDQLESEIKVDQKYQYIDLIIDKTYAYRFGIE